MFNRTTHGSWIWLALSVQQHHFNGINWLAVFNSTTSIVQHLGSSWLAYFVQQNHSWCSMEPFTVFNRTMVQWCCWVATFLKVSTLYMVKHPKIVMTLKYFQIFWFCVWKCEKECVKVCGNLKSWIPSHRRFHRYLKLQKRTYIAKVMIILSFSQKYIFHMHKIVARHWIAIWGLRSAQIKKL